MSQQGNYDGTSLAPEQARELTHRAAADLVIVDQADTIARHEEAHRQHVALIADLADEIVQLRAFADHQFRRRAIAEWKLEQLSRERRPVQDAAA
jgi:hypothetical protein